MYTVNFFHFHFIFCFSKNLLFLQFLHFSKILSFLSFSLLFCFSKNCFYCQFLLLRRSNLHLIDIYNLIYQHLLDYWLILPIFLAMSNSIFSHLRMYDSNQFDRQLSLSQNEYVQFTKVMLNLQNSWCFVPFPNLFEGHGFVVL